jgi:superfamily I DNA and/or RNA helicase
MHEARVVAAVTAMVIGAGLDAKDIGIITPYAAQVQWR